MKSRKTNEVIAGGVDQRWKASDNLASNIVNCRIDSVGLGWKNDRGWEPLIPEESGQVTFSDAQLAKASAPCRFLKVWSRHGGSEVYYLEERNGILSYTYGNRGNGGAAGAIVELDTGRNLPKADDPGTQITPFGRFALIQNGYDRPIKFWGRAKTTPFGWSQNPSAPIVRDVNNKQIYDPDKLQSTEGSYWTQAASVGVGNSDLNDKNLFRYKVSLVSDTGSESPLSDSANVYWAIQDNAVVGHKAGIVLKDIPTGDVNTVARRIYRTKNLIENPAEQYYLVKEIKDNVTTDWIDIIPDGLLLETAPAVTDSVLLPQSFKYAASFNGCIWIAGGDDLSTQIRYSDRYLPEQFDAFRFFDVGMRSGGEVTALVPYGNNLVVFRANSIEVISPIADDAYTIGTLAPDIGTRATNTIKEVPGLGLFFLSKDGCYVIKGGQSGAGLVQLGIEHISKNLYNEWERLSEGSLARATAVYSTREKEYWVHYPVDGGTENTRGAVYHTEVGQWSLRNQSYGKVIGLDDDYQMAFTHLDTDPEGWIIIGTYPDYPYSAETTLTAGNRHFYPGVGLQVWSSTCYFGKVWSFQTSGENFTTYSWVWNPKVDDDCVWESVWLDFGDDSIKKRIQSVELEMVSQGYRKLELEYASDYTFTESAGGTMAPMIVEKYLTTSSEPTWYLASDKEVKNKAVWGDNWSNGQICRLRFDIHTGLVSQFKYRIKSANPFHLISYQLEYMASEQKVITRRGGSGT